MLIFFFFNDTATTEIYTLSLHDALPIYTRSSQNGKARAASSLRARTCTSRSTMGYGFPTEAHTRSEEHTSELQSRQYLVCRLLLEKKKNHQELPSVSPHFNRAHRSDAQY